MKNLFLITVAIFSILSFQSCTRHWVPLTQKVVNDYHLDTADLKRMQFATSDFVKMQREAVKGNAQVVKKGKLLVGIDGKVEAVYIKTMQKGMCVDIPQKGVLSISFEVDASKFLNYKLFQGDTGCLLFPNDSIWNGNHEKIYYGGKTSKFLYETTSDMVDRPYLYADITKYRKLKFRFHAAKGRRAK